MEGRRGGVGGILQGLVGFSAGEFSTVEQVLRGMPIRIAAGNSHLIIAAASISAAAVHLGVSAQQGTQVPWNLVAITIPAVLIGGQLAAVLAGRIPQDKLRIILGAFLVFIGALSAYRAAVGSGIRLPGWALSAILLTLSAVTLFFFANGDAAWKTARLRRQLARVSQTHPAPIWIKRQTTWKRPGLWCRSRGWCTNCRGLAVLNPRSARWG